MAETIVSVKSVSKSFAGNKILDEVDFDFEIGGFYALIGKSGCGKSTLLRCLNGLEILDSGVICVDGVTMDAKKDHPSLLKTCHEIRSHVGMVFQSFQLFPHMTLIENVKKPQMIVKKISDEEAHQRAMDFLNKVGLKDHTYKYPYQLSGGQQQRGSIARALALKPKVMLYDEPTSALDPQLVDEVNQVMRDLDLEGMTQIIVTHDMRFARDVADDVIYMDQGKILETGTPSEMFANPKNESTKSFLRKYL